MRGHHALALLDIGAITPKELLDARIAIEPSIAAMAAITAQPADIEQMRECALKREKTPKPGPYNLWDHRLHLTIAETARNPILIALVVQINNLRHTPKLRHQPQESHHGGLSAPSSPRAGSGARPVTDRTPGL